MSDKSWFVDPEKLDAIILIKLICCATW